MIAHTELASRDPHATKDFLERVFDWKFESVQTPQGELMPYRTPGGAQGSVKGTKPGEDPVSMNYILVEDIGGAEKKIIASGGEIVLARVDVPKMGSFFWFKVPGGPVLACWADSPERKV
jgi:predicted enzyme related to lactoylglutathione lyase